MTSQIFCMLRVRVRVRVKIRVRFRFRVKIRVKIRVRVRHHKMFCMLRVRVKIRARFRIRVRISIILKRCSSPVLACTPASAWKSSTFGQCWVSRWHSSLSLSTWCIQELIDCHWGCWVPSRFRWLGRREAEICNKELTAD